MTSYSLQVMLVGMVTLLISVCHVYSSTSPPPPCPSSIYCQGELLHTVQMARLYKDSKTFVDKKLKYPPSQVIQEFEKLKSSRMDLNQSVIREFVDRNFDPEGSEFEEWIPNDWVEKPDFVSRVADPGLKSWALQLHSFWKELGRKIKVDVKNNPELYSIVYVSHPFIVPGGRFREFYYWDSYWVIKGLLLSEMKETVKGMLQNFLEMVNTIGYVPNGGRVYYERSQPPLLIPMFKLYMDATNDQNFLKSSLPVLAKEFNFWMENRTVPIVHKGKVYKVARYNVEMTGPRPESYREDYELASHLKTEEEKHELYYNLKSGAESGWDFSSRWFQPENDNVKPDLGVTKTRDIGPVDLNSFLYLNAKILAEFYNKIGNSGEAAHYENVANEWKSMINEVLWDEDQGSWFDLDLKNGNLRKEFYPSNIAPIWAGAQNSPIAIQRFMTYLKKSTALKFVSGVPTSLITSGEQWDFPNGWPPLQHLIVEALDQSGNPEAQALAFELAEKWIATNYEAYYQSEPNHMFEKYDVTIRGLPGGGGEYDVVVGFGWTNGVVLDFLNRYGDRLQAKKKVEKNGQGSVSPTFVASVAFSGLALILSNLVG